MKPVLSTALLLAASQIGLTSAGPVGLCTQLTYADGPSFAPNLHSFRAQLTLHTTTGGIYCRTTPTGGCLADLGDFPARVSFPWAG